MEKVFYNWEYVNTYSPFRNIISKYTDLKVMNKTKANANSGECEENTYRIKANYNKYVKNLKKIKREILASQICKKNEDIREYIYNLTEEENAFKFLVKETCIPNNVNEKKDIYTHKVI